MIEGLVSHIDLHPTLCEQLGIGTPAWCEGHSLLPLVRGQARKVRDAVFCEQAYHGRYIPLRGVRTQRYAYVRRIGEARSAHDYAIDGGQAREFLRAQGLDRRPVPREQLYDLHFDPHEAHNVAGEADCAGVLTEMRERLDRWMEATDDPARDDTIPQPPPEPEWARQAFANKGDWGARWAQTRQDLQAPPAR